MHNKLKCIFNGQILGIFGLVFECITHMTGNENNFNFKDMFQDI